jgi:hypothetical protein
LTGRVLSLSVTDYTCLLGENRMGVVVDRVRFVYTFVAVVWFVYQTTI